MAIDRSTPTVLTSTGQEWQFHIATNITGQKWQIHIAADIYWSWMAISTLLPMSSGQEWQLADLTLDLLADLPPNASWDIYYGMCLTAILDSSRKGENFLLILNN